MVDTGAALELVSKLWEKKVNDQSTEFNFQILASTTSAVPFHRLFSHLQGVKTSNFTCQFTIPSHNWFPPGARVDWLIDWSQRSQPADKMRRFHQFIIATALLLLVNMISSGSGLSTDGSRILDASGQPLDLRGINWWVGIEECGGRRKFCLQSRFSRLIWNFYFILKRLLRLQLLSGLVSTLGLRWWTACGVVQHWHWTLPR